MNSELLSELVRCASVMGVGVRKVPFSQNLAGCIEVEWYGEGAYLDPKVSEANNAPACYLLRKAMAEKGYGWNLTNHWMQCFTPDGKQLWHESEHGETTENTIRAFIAAAQHHATEQGER